MHQIKTSIMNIKIKVKNESHSKAIQERLFELGFCWNRGKTTQFTDKPFLFADSGDMHLAYVNNESYFKRHAYTEVTLDDLYDTVKEHTMEELTKILGYEFKIKKINRYYEH